MKQLSLAIAIGLALTLVSSARAQTAATLIDYGVIAPTPGPSDVAQLLYGGGNPSGLNYYFDNSSPPGQTFTTGNDPNGYLLNTLSIQTAGGGGNLPAGGQAYRLRLYQVAGSNATLIATYQSQDAFTFVETDWLQWTNLGTPLLSNGQYAYTLARVSAGWENLGNVAGDPYAGGAAAVIPPNGGAINFGTATDFDATFVAGLNVASSLAAGAATIAPASAVTIGTAVTISGTAVGPAPVSYQWRTDGGNGGTLSNIPSATSPTLAVDTSGLTTGFYRYAFVVTNSSGSITSAPVTLIVSPVVVAIAASLTDQGSIISSGIDDINQLVGDSGGSYDGLNYYSDNGANNNGWMGQTFTTGANAQGYYLDSVSLQTGGGGSSGTTTLQPYHLYLYQVQGNTAALIAHYTNASFAFTFGDWLKWSGFSQVLKPNTTYAYGFGRAATGGTGWAGLNSSSTNTDLYTGGQISSIPSAGGAVTFGTTGNEDAVFNVGLLPVGVGPSPLPFAQPIAISPAQVVVVGSQVNLIEATTNGIPPLHYQWRTDGGTGTYTNIPSTDVTNLLVNTTGWTPGVYRYQVVVNNTYGYSTSAVAAVTVVFANTTATLVDAGITLAPPLAMDVSQLTIPGGANSPDGLNYYFDNASPPGQTFTTGSNPAGYTLTSLAIALAGNSGQLPAAGQAYLLRLYKVSGAAATLYAVYSSQSNVTFGVTDWVRWSGFAVPLAANTTYAYSFARVSNGSGWDNLANVTGNLYPGGEVALIPANGGAMTFGSSHSYDGTFVIGLAVPGLPNVAPTAFAPPSPYAGSPVVASAAVSGTGPFTYQWQTDGGTGGALANIPGQQGPTLTIDTTGLDGLNVAYALVVSNGAGSTTNEAGILAVFPASPPFVVTDTTPASASGFPGGTASFSAAFTGTLPITYQWQVDKGSGATNIPGQTSASLTISNLQVSDSGNYSLVASNFLGSVGSSVATLTVYPQPTAPFIANFQWHSTQGGNDVGAYAGTGVPGFGTGTLWNQVIGPSANNGATVTYLSSSGYNDTGATDLGVSWSVTCSESWDWTSTPVIALLDSAVTARPSASFSFTLPNGLYNLVLFSCNGFESTNANAGAVFTINGATQTALPTQDTSFVQGNNYVVFNNLVATGTKLAGTVTAAAGKQYGSLNGAQLQYLGPAVTLSIQPVSGGQIQLQWSQGTLLEAASVTGPWATNLAASPYTLPPAGVQKYYRVIVK